MQIKEQVEEFVIENFLFGQSNDLQEDDSFLEKGIIDSTGVLELVSFIERQFGIKINDADLIPDNLDSVTSVTGFIERKLNGANGES